MSFFLGIDTSNYTTSLAIADDNGIIENRKLLLPVKQGERGLRQSDAVFAHIKNIPAVFDSLEKREYVAVGFSAYPRDNEGSYMPCFECGRALASAIGSVLSVPVYEFSHQMGHIKAAAYSAGCEELIDNELIAFHVSGGTTELLHINDGRIELVGGTKDLNAGQIIDRVGVMLGLHFPCGRELEKLSDGIPHQKVKICVDGLFCNLSGVENQTGKMLRENISKKIIAAYTLDFILETLSRLTENALGKFGNLPILYAGGVMSDSRIRQELEKRFYCHFAKPEFSSDNAAGIALLTRDCYMK